MTDLTGKRILIVATHGVEKVELTGVRDELRRRGARVTVASPDGGPITSFEQIAPSDEIGADMRIDAAGAAGFDALYLPGGIINPDLLRLDTDALGLVQEFHEAGKPVGALCHAPWLLISAGLVDGRGIAAWPSLRVDLENAGAAYVDEAAVVEGLLVTGRNPDDIPAFAGVIAAEDRVPA